MKKTPLYAALDLHSRYSVLGSMDHEGNSQPRMRFPTEANILRAEVEALRKRRRPVYLTMEAGAMTRWAGAIVRPLVERLIICEPRYNRRSEEHTSELQSPDHLVCRLLLEKKKTR